MSTFGDTPTTSPLGGGSPTSTQGLVGFFESSTSTATLTGLTTDFTFTATVATGRVYEFYLHSQYASANWQYTLNVTDGATTWTLGTMSTSAGAWLGASQTLASSLLYFPATSGTKTFSVVLSAKGGSGAETLQFLANATARRQFWLKDLGQYPVSGNDLGLVAYAQSTSNLTIPGGGGNDSLSTTVAYNPQGFYRLAYRLHMANTYSGIGTCSVYDGSLNYQLMSVTQGLTVRRHTQLILPKCNGAKTLTPAWNVPLQLNGSAAEPRQLWIERIA